VHCSLLEEHRLCARSAAAFHAIWRCHCHGTGLGGPFSIPYVTALECGPRFLYSARSVAETTTSRAPLSRPWMYSTSYGSIWLSLNPRPASPWNSRVTRLESLAGLAWEPVPRFLIRDAVLCGGWGTVVSTFRTVHTHTYPAMPHACFAVDAGSRNLTGIGCGSYQGRAIAEMGICSG
jgi:hypothetical protein